MSFLPPIFLGMVNILWMEEILHHLGWLKPYKQWEKASIKWCRISSIHSTTYDFMVMSGAPLVLSGMVLSA